MPTAPTTDAPAVTDQPAPDYPDESGHETPVSAAAAARLTKDPWGRLYDPHGERAWLWRETKALRAFFDRHWSALPPGPRDEAFDFLRRWAKAHYPNPPSHVTLYLAREKLRRWLPDDLFAELPVIAQPPIPSEQSPPPTNGTSTQKKR